MAILDKSKLVFLVSFWNTFWRDSRIVLVDLDKSKHSFKEFRCFLVYFCVMKIRFLPDETKKVVPKRYPKTSFNLSRMANTIRGKVQKSAPKRYPKDQFQLVQNDQYYSGNSPKKCSKKIHKRPFRADAAGKTQKYHQGQQLK